MSLTVRGPGMSSAGLRASYASFERSVSRMSSGMRITRAADNAAGLAISEGLRARVNGSAIAARNVQDGIGMLQTAEGGLAAITSMLQRARDLAVQSASGGSLDAAARAAIAAETRQLVAEIDRTARSTGAHGMKLLDGSRTGGFVFQVGAEVGETLSVASSDVRASTLGLLGAPGGMTAATTTTSFVPVTSQVTRSDAFSTWAYASNEDYVFSVNGQTTSTKFTGRPGGYAQTVEDHQKLAADFNTLLTRERVAVTASITDAGTASARLVFTASDGSGAQVDVTGTGATTHGISRDTVTTQSEVTTTTQSEPYGATPSLADLVLAGSPDAIRLASEALTTVVARRGELGAVQNRMEHRLSILATTGDNLAAARSRIADADMAQEYAGLVRAQLLIQAGTAMQAQGAQGGQRVLQLLSAR